MQIAQILFLVALAGLIVAGVRLRKTAIGVGILSGLVVGFLASGTGGRIVMRIIAVADPNTVTRFTLSGTLFLLLGMGLFGALFGGFAGLLFVGIRRWLPVPGPWKGLAFGALLLLGTGGLFFSGGQDENFSDFEPPLLGLALFASLYLVYGLGVGAVLERFHSYVPPVSQQQRATTLIGFAVLAIVCAFGLYLNAQAIGDILAAAG